MTVDELRQSQGHAIRQAAAARGAHNVRVFGSIARGEADGGSDIDLLVDLEPGRTLFDLSALSLDLESLLGTHVDLVTEKGLRERIRQRVLSEAVKL